MRTSLDRLTLNERNGPATWTYSSHPPHAAAIALRSPSGSFLIARSSVRARTLGVTVGLR
jgi:hypothetical protein